MTPPATRLPAGILGTALALPVVLVWWLAAPPPAAEAVRHTCANYRSQAAAQAAYRADPRGLAQLDADRNGIACENLPGPFDRVPVHLAAAAPAPAAARAPTRAAPAPARPGLARLPRAGGAADLGGVLAGSGLAAMALGATARAVYGRAR